MIYHQEAGAKGAKVGEARCCADGNRLAQSGADPRSGANRSAGRVEPEPGPQAQGPPGEGRVAAGVTLGAQQPLDRRTAQIGVGFEQFGDLPYLTLAGHKVGGINLSLGGPARPGGSTSHRRRVVPNLLGDLLQGPACRFNPGMSTYSS
jgi:hypothetical protein